MVGWQTNYVIDFLIVMLPGSQGDIINSASSFYEACYLQVQGGKLLRIYIWTVHCLLCAI